MLKDFLTVLVGWVLGLSIVVGGLFVITAGESDPWFNCHLSGNMVCGPETAWHGFVNGFSSDNTP